MLVILGLVISVPIVVWGSALVLKLVDRYPAIMWIGAAVIGWTAAKMIGGSRCWRTGSRGSRGCESRCTR